MPESASLVRLAALLAQHTVAMEADGGGVDIVGLDGETLTLRLRGACRDCPSRALTIAYTLEPIVYTALGPTISLHVI